MQKKFIPHVLRNGEFVVLACEPVTARQAAAMLETTTDLLLFVERPRLQSRHLARQSDAQAPSPSRPIGDQACP
jgi:hypothetical protein